MRRVLFVVLILSVCSWAQTARTPQDGSWWKSLSPIFKVAFVSGYAQGNESAASQSIGTCMALFTYANGIKEKYTSEQWQKVCFPSEDFDGIKMGQFVNGLDSFYGDYRNQQIEFGSALGYVRDGIKGKPQEELQKEIEQMRKLYSLLSH